jgi:hypothetical protein
MGLLGKTLYTARIALWNLADADVGAGEPVTATVELGSERDDSGLAKPAIAYLVPLLAVTLLRNSRNQAETTLPIMEIVRRTADELLGGEGSARALRIRDLAYSDLGVSFGTTGDSEVEWIVRAGIPELTEPSAGRPTKLMRTRLLERRGARFATMRGVGNSYQATYGFFALLEHTARTHPYDEVVEPVAGALRELSLVYSEVLEGRAPSFGAASGLNELVCMRMSGAIGD